MAPSKADAVAQHSPPPYSPGGYRHRKWPQLNRRFQHMISGIVLLFFFCICAVLYTGATPDPKRVAVLSSQAASLETFQQSLELCAARSWAPAEPAPETRESNPRWNAERGQNETIALRNATLFDGETFLPSPVDIVFSKGLIVSVTPASTAASILEHGKEYQVMGKFVTPGVVDMHSHHLASVWPGSEATDDTNEMHALFGPLTPFLRITESMKAYDPGTKVIASGGITSSLLIPGSANTMGGEGIVVKNMLQSGEHGEYVVQEMLLERNVPVSERRRYMKLACGENPKGIYGHTRMALAYLLRQHLTRAKELMEKQNKWCAGAETYQSSGPIDKAWFLEEMGKFPESVELESTIALIRGQVAMHNHCYEPQDFETMLGVMHEFGVKVRAFHHAIEAWEVPEMLKAYGDNVTIATFAETSLYKHEAYDPSLYAGAILDAHGIPVAYKSDHVQQSTNAKYVMSQAAAGHAFHLPADRALQAVTSVPAKALRLGFRIGYARKGYDADIVVWDSHPLSIGATPLQVYIDGVATLDPKKVKESTGSTLESLIVNKPGLAAPQMRTRKSAPEAESFCSEAKGPSKSYIVRGIKKSFLDHYAQHDAAVSVSEDQRLSLVINRGVVTCLSTAEDCEDAISDTSRDAAMEINLDNGHILPGLTAVTGSLGMIEIMLDATTGNGVAPVADVKDPKYVDYAKYGVTLDGKAFVRARLGGVTRAITAPQFPLFGGGMLQGVSAGIRTSGNKTVLDGGIFQDEVGLHVVVGDANKVTGSVSMAIKTLRSILVENQGKGNASAYGLVADGLRPLIIQVGSVSDTQQVVAIKKDFPRVKIVIRGGAGAPLVAKEIASADIPVILSATRPGPATWEVKDCLVGPPLTRSPASILSEAGVKYAISVDDEVPIGDSRIHDLALEAAWVAKYAALSDHDAIRLVSKNVEDILGLKPSKDIVLWENDPMQWGASVVLAFEETTDGRLEVATCWPDDPTGELIGKGQ